MVLVFTVTLAVFPSVASLVSSVGHNITWRAYFTPVLCFLLFNVGDAIGRLLVNVVQWVKRWNQTYKRNERALFSLASVVHCILFSVSYVLESLQQLFCVTFQRAQGHQISLWMPIGRLALRLARWASATATFLRWRQRRRAGGGNEPRRKDKEILSQPCQSRRTWTGRLHCQYGIFNEYSARLVRLDDHCANNHWSCHFYLILRWVVPIPFSMIWPDRNKRGGLS